jgi:thiol:disulfide interchange protein DsbD
MFVFFAGFLTSFTPCIFPMIPITLAVLVPKGERLHFGKKLRRSLLYVLGIALTYSVFGVLAATSGLMFGSILGNRWVALGLGMFFLAFAISMLGFFEIKTPQRLSNSFLFSSTNTFFYGLAAGVVAGPCVGPVLLSILTFISKTGNITTGFVLMMAFAFGMGLIFIILGIAGDFAKILPTSGAWMNGVKYVFALIMAGLSFYYVRPVLTPAQFIIYAAFAAGAVATCYLLFYEKKLYVPLSTAARRFFAAAVVISLVVIAGTWAFAGKIDDHAMQSEYENGWRPYSPSALEESLKNGKPTILDFYADWCLSCKELKYTTFRDPAVIAKNSSFNLLVVDATNTSEDVAKLKRSFNVIGLPAVFFYSKTGALLNESTLNGFENSESFLKRMDTVLQHE